MSFEDLKLSPQATFYIPGPDDTPVSLLNRWSNTYVSLPAAVAVPYSEADIAALIFYAKQHGFNIVVAGGKHFPAVPVNSQTLYVDLKNFTSIKIDEKASTMSVGGGASTGAVLEALTSAGYFTAVPNTDSVGFVGAFLGGGSSGLNSVKGFMIDHAVSIRVVTAAGETLKLGPQSEGEEQALWHAFRGAGHGLAVATELTLRIYPLSDLGMDDNKIWMRTLVFPPPAIGTASQLFSSLQAIRGPFSSNLIVARSPPESPMPDAPVIVVSASYFGPSAEAEKTLSCLFNADVLSATVVASTSLVPMNAMNNGTKAVEMRGGFKRSDATLLRNTVNAATIERTFNRFLQLGADATDTMRSGVVFFAFDPSVLQNQGKSEEAERGFFEARDTRCIVYHDIWFREQTSVSIIDSYLPQSIETVRTDENGPMRRFANFMQHPANLTETYSEAKITEKIRVKTVWDPENVFWTPGI